MRDPGHWAKVTVEVRPSRGRVVRLSRSAWSPVSEADARRRAREVVDRLVERVRTGVQLNCGPYSYTDRPLREEGLSQVAGPAGEVAATVTRNGYGVRVLNAARLFMIDVDFPGPPWGGWLRRLLSPSPHVDPAGWPLVESHSVSCPRGSWLG